MKKTGKTLVASVLIVSMCLSMSGCSKAAKECKEMGTEFIELAFSREIDDMADLCEDDDEALAAFAPYASEYDSVDALLDRATVEAGKADFKKDNGSVVFTITLPDYDAALDEEPEDCDEFEDLLDEADTVEIEVTLEFVNKRDKWYIDNFDDFVEDFYEELYDIDFGFESEYEGWIATENWWGADGSVYSGSRYYLDLDLNIVSDYYSNEMRYYFVVYKTVILSSQATSILTADSSRITAMPRTVTLAIISPQERTHSFFTIQMMLNSTDPHVLLSNPVLSADYEGCPTPGQPFSMFVN